MMLLGLMLVLMTVNKNRGSFTRDTFVVMSRVCNHVD